MTLTMTACLNGGKRARLFMVMLKIIWRAVQSSQPEYHKRLLRWRRLQGGAVYAILACDPLARAW